MTASGGYKDTNMPIDLSTYENGYYGYLSEDVREELGNIQDLILTGEQQEILNYFSYDAGTEIITTNRAIETTLNSLYLGKQHKMSSGAENIYFTNLGSDINWYPMWAGLKDQSLTANQGASGYIPPSGRIYSDMFSLPLGGQPDPLTSIGYAGENYFGVNIAGLGITVEAAEEVESDVALEYRISVNGRQVYSQSLPRGAQLKTTGSTIYPGDQIEWWFDHPVDIAAGTTLYAEIHKVRKGDGTIDSEDVDLGIFQVRAGDTVDPNTGLVRYQATVHNRLFEDKDLELISPYLKYTAMDFGVDSTGVSILLRDLSLPVGEQMLIPHNINTLEAVANGTTIQIKVKDGAKVIMESLPVSGASINGVLVNSVLNNAVTELNNLFTNALSFASQGNPVTSFVLSGDDLTLGLADSTSYTVDVTTLGVDTNNYVASGSLNGSDLTLTMADATTVVIDASSLDVDTNTTITFGTLDPNTNILTLNASDSSTVSIDVSALAVDTNLHVTNGSVNGTDLDLTMSDGSTVTVAVGSLAIDNNTTISGGTVSGTDIILSLSDASIITIDASNLSTGGGTNVVSGVVSGTDLVLTMSDATTVTIDATNMINGSTGFATGADWYISYGTYANQSVNSTSAHSDNNRNPPSVAGKAPFYFGTTLERGTEFRWNNNPNQEHVFGIWDGTEAEAGTYNSRVPGNWSLAFNYPNSNGFTASSNTSLTNTTSSSNYAPADGALLALRFLSSGDVTLSDLSGALEVEIARTNSPLAVQSFQLQLGCDAGFVFPQIVAQESDNLWTIAHDYNNVEAGILNGILDHTVLKSGVSIVEGEKLMFMLDEVGQGDFFGTGYTNAATGILTAEEQLDNQFIYQTNEAIVMTIGGASDWTPNTSATGYFFAAGLHQYRQGGAGVVQGMFSLRFNGDGSLTIYDEDSDELVATSTATPTPGVPIHLYFGVRGNRAYYSIPVVSKQSLTAGNQPTLTFAPDVSNQTFNVTEGDAFSLQIALDAGSDIVNMYGEVDAPSWAVLNQVTGEFIGTAPAFTGSSDSYVINCKAANAIGGITSFTVTVNVTEVAYTNSKSLSFNGTSSWLQGNPTTMTALERATNGDGNAWSLSFWVKPDNNTATQTLFVYGAGDDYNGGTITVKKINTNTLAIVYGTVYNNIITLANVLNHSQWSHVLITFDGGTTGANGADVADYYSRFNVYLNGFAASTVGVNSNQGYTGDISGQVVSDNIFRIGRASNVHNNYLDGTINQVAIWDTDQGANVTAIYNAGSAQDLSDLTVPPAHYYEIETSVTSVPDLTGSADLTGYNFSTSDLVTDTP